MDIKSHCLRIPSDLRNFSDFSSDLVHCWSSIRFIRPAPRFFVGVVLKGSFFSMGTVHPGITINIETLRDYY